MKLTSSEELKKLRTKAFSEKKKERTIYVCAGTGCRAKGGYEIYEGLQKLIDADTSLKSSVDIKATGCHGFCEKGPLIVFYPDDILGDDAMFKRAELNENQLRNSVMAMALYSELMLKYPGSIFTIEARKRYRYLRGDNIN